VDRESRPIAAAMLPFPGVLPDGSRVQEQPAEVWAATLGLVAEAGFEHVDPTDSWLRIADLPTPRLDEFAAAVRSVGLAIPAVSTSRRSVIDPQHGQENLAYSHRVLDAAAAVGARVANFGFFRALTPAQRDALWFWTAPGSRDPDDPAIWDLAVRRIRELAHHADEVGVDISLEMYEDTYLGTADGAVRFIHDVDHPRVGLNPDLGNLIRMHRRVEAWESMAKKTLPLANYWHVKNYFRSEDASSGQIVTFPAPLEFGVIDYRTAVRLAIDAGFRGPFCCEHYGGDGLGVSAANRRYLQRVLPRHLPSPCRRAMP
jgi:sugar phosphate isomerase/epimerase